MNYIYGGAEAVSINEQRIISTSEIKCVGPAIQVNNEKLTPPYVIKAIGNKEGLKQTLMDSSVIEAFRKRTLRLQIDESDDMEIKAYEKKLNFEYIKAE